MIATPRHALPSPESFSAPYFFFSNDKDTQITYISPSVQKVMGYAPSCIIGHSYNEFLDLTDPLGSDINYYKDKRFDKGSTHASNLRVVCRAADGSKKILQIQSYGEADESGCVIFNHGIAQDVTQSVLLKSELQDRLRILEVVKKALSTREENVLERVMAGRLNKSIARELGVTERTIESARSRLMKKFQANTSAELVCKATELQMLASMIRVSGHFSTALPPIPHLLSK